MPKRKQPHSFPVVRPTVGLEGFLTRQPLPAISFKGESSPYTRLFNKLLDRKWPPYVADEFCCRLFPEVAKAARYTSLAIHTATGRVQFTVDTDAGPPF